MQIIVGITVVILVIVVTFIYPLLRGNTREQFDSINLTELKTPVYQQVRGQEYGEVVAVYRYFNNLKAAIYYTNFGEAKLMDEQYEKIKTEDAKKQLGTFYAIKNGPRFWVIDEITGYYMGKSEIISGYKFEHPGVLSLTMADLKKRKPYEEKAVNRKTLYRCRKGEKIYELISDKGVVYTMQSASRETDKNLTFTDLDSLGSSLKLPKGWKYQVRVLDKDEVFNIKNTAYVIQDNLNNTYQRNPEQ